MDTLFDEVERSFKGPANHNENSYDYYNRSARANVSIVRRKLNEWYNDYPDIEKKELKSRFKKEFNSAFYELFIFHFFKKLGFSIAIHPKISNSSKRPDFLLKKDDIEIYVEAKIDKGKSKEKEALERKIDELYDNLSKIKLKGFVLQIDTIHFKNKNQPNSKRINRYLEEKINVLDSTYLRAAFEAQGYSAIHSIEYEDDDILIKVEPIPIAISAQDADYPAIGAYPSKFLLGGGEDTIRSSINKKAKRYGKLNKPFLLCLNALNEKTSGESDVENAIWGSEALSFSDDPSHRDHRWVRKWDGIFINEKGPRLKNLSGVLITKVYPFNIPNANYWLFEHPFTENKLDFKALGVKYSYLKDSRIAKATGQDLDEIFSIPKDWLKH